MIESFIEWIGLVYSELSQLDQIFVSVVFGIIAVNFVFDIIRYLLYIISRR